MMNYRWRTHCLVLIVPVLILLWAIPVKAGQQSTRGNIVLHVDASEITRKIVHSKLEVPAPPGKLTLYYPKWIPGKHSPAGPIADLAGLKIMANNKAIPWQRDEIDGYALHCEVPEGAKSITVNLDYLVSGSGIGKPAVSAKLAVLSWDQVLLYPKGKTADEIIFQVNLKLPKGWQYGTALPNPPGIQNDGPWARFQPVSLYTLIDSPVLCGEYVKRVALAPKIQPAHFLVLAGDSKKAIELPVDLKEDYDRMVTEAVSLFGSTPYRTYTFTLALSDHVPPGGLEHHESSDNRLPEDALHDPALRKSSAGLLPHELVHAWNGKYRRPKSMITPDYQVPHKTKMLWVYEGLTSYLDDMIATRCGLLDQNQMKDNLAAIAHRMNNHKGRKWRPLQDTAVGAHVLYQAKGGWNSWRRSLDYYDEGTLIWLEIDVRLRKLTKGKKSLDDFCRIFFAAKNGQPAVKGYDLDSLCETLNQVAPYEWKALIVRRVTLPNETAPMEGLHMAGWKLSYSDQPNAMLAAREKARKYIDHSSSIGLILSPSGTVSDVIEGSPAYKAGIGPGMMLLAVNSRRWTPALLKTAIAETKDGQKLKLLLENEDFFQTHSLNYNGGLRYPNLERISLSEPDLLEQIYSPKVK